MIAFLRSQMEAKAAVGCKEALCFLAISGFFTLYPFWDIRVTDTLVFLFPFLYAISALRGRWMEKLFWVLITAVVMLTMTNLCIGVFLPGGLRQAGIRSCWQKPPGGFSLWGASTCSSR